MQIIEFIDHKSKFLAEVINLGNKNSSTLGFLPIGGFQEHAKKRWIIVIHENEELQGYLLFRLSSKTFKVSITHLCVSPQHRGAKIAVKLLDQLKNKFKNSFSGISLSCRKDYIEAGKLWAKYGFVSRSETRSRSIDENYLVKWWYDFNKVDLFSLLEQNSSKIKVVLDANIVIKYRDDYKQENADVKAIFADWIVDELDYYIAQEIYNEIHRDNDRIRAEKTRSFISKKFKIAKFDKDESIAIAEQLFEILSGTTDNDISDRKQIAECISSAIEYFVTGDGNILNKRNEIQEKFGITILDPLELILEIDKISSRESYHPTRLSGASQTLQKVENKDIDILIDKFWKQKFFESKQDFRNKVTQSLIGRTDGRIKTVNCLERGILAFWGYHVSESSLHVNFLRIVENSLSNTLFIQLIHELINEAITFKLNVICIENDWFSDSETEILSSFGFNKKENLWTKVAVFGLIESSQLLQKFPALLEHLQKGFYEEILAMQNGELKTKFLYEIERNLYPLKFSDLDIPTYIVPIKPYWAGQLFDKYTSSTSLFGADATKIWNKHNVYYRNIRPVQEKFPSRILWYLSSENGFYRQNGIVATSYMDGVNIDTVKKQFSKFKKYGIYEWKDVYNLAKGDVRNEIKAIRFSDTEVFPSILNFSEITNILLANNRKRNTFTSPVEVDQKIFNEIYRFFLT